MNNSLKNIVIFIHKLIKKQIFLQKILSQNKHHTSNILHIKLATRTPHMKDDWQKPSIAFGHRQPHCKIDKSKTTPAKKARRSEFAPTLVSRARDLIAG